MVKRACLALFLSLGLMATSAAAVGASEELGGLDLEAYCQAEGYDGLLWVKPLSGAQAAIDNFHCFTSAESLHQISYVQACQYHYGLQAVRFQFLDLDDATSGVCFTPEGSPLGGLDLDAYCQSIGFDGVVWINDLWGPQAAIDNFHCLSSEALHQISYVQACQFQYDLKAVRFQFLDLDDATSGVCFSTGT